MAEHEHKASSNGEEGEEVTPQHARAQLVRILSDDMFTRSQVHSRFLKTVVDETLAGNSPKASFLLRAVFEAYQTNRTGSGSDDAEAKVRVEAGRLRQKLLEYYLKSTCNDFVVIDIPKGGYAAHFQYRRLPNPEPPERRPQSPQPSLLVVPDSVSLLAFTSLPSPPLMRRGIVWSIALSALLVLAAGLPVLWQILRLPAEIPGELTQERLTFNSSERPVSSFALSKDAKYLAYADLAGIHVKFLSTGEERVIPKPKYAAANASWEVASWFQDGSRLLAHLGSRDLDETGGSASTWVIFVFGQPPRKLKDHAWSWELSPDGSRIAFSPRRSANDDAREIWIMDSQGSNPRKVLSASGNEWLSKVRWSPDGRRLAYFRARRYSRDSTNSIETCDLDGANGSVAVPPEVGHWHDDYAWLPDGRIIYSRQGAAAIAANALWQVRIDNRLGRPLGKPNCVTNWPDSEAVNLSTSADGKHMAVLKQMSHGQIEIGDLTADGTRINAPRQLTNDEAFGFPSDWTPDSAGVLLTFDHNGKTTIVSRIIAQQTTERLTTTDQIDGVLPRVSPDGKWVIYMVDSPSSFYASQRLMRVPVTGGNSEFVLGSRNWIDHACGRGHASCVLTEKSEDGKWRQLTEFDPMKGRGKLLRTIPDVPNYDWGRPAEALSANGFTYAVARTSGDHTRIQLLSLSNGPDQEIVVKGWINMTGMEWAHDGKGFYCGSMSPEGRTLLYVDLKGRAQILRQYYGVGNGKVLGVPSPDGHSIAVLAGALSSNVWMLVGF